MTYVSSVDNRIKREYLNNVLLSLNCFITCTTNDCTIQDYGLVSYSGPLIIGQEIKGSRIPSKPTPIIYNGMYVGIIKENGVLTVENNKQTFTSSSSEYCFCDIRYTVYNCCSIGNNYTKEKTNTDTSARSYSCNGYCITETTIIDSYSITENCTFTNAYMNRCLPAQVGCYLVASSYGVQEDGVFNCTCIHHCTDTFQFTGCDCIYCLSCFTNGKTEYCIPPNGCVLDINLVGTFTYTGDWGCVGIRMTAVCSVKTIICTCTCIVNSINMKERYL